MREHPGMNKDTNGTADGGGLSVGQDEVAFGTRDSIRVHPGAIGHAIASSASAGAPVLLIGGMDGKGIANAIGHDLTLRDWMTKASGHRLDRVDAAIYQGHQLEPDDLRELSMGPNKPTLDHLVRRCGQGSPCVIVIDIDPSKTVQRATLRALVEALAAGMTGQADLPAGSSILVTMPETDDPRGAFLALCAGSGSGPGDHAPDAFPAISIDRGPA
jgi:hypothetical protein